MSNPKSAPKKTSKKADAPVVKPGGGIPTLEAILGIEPAQQFQYAGRVFTSNVMTLTEQVAHNAAVMSERLDTQAENITTLLNARLVVGEPVTVEEVMNLDMTSLQRLVMMLQGQFRPRADGAEGKPKR